MSTLDRAKRFETVDADLVRVYRAMSSEERLAAAFGAHALLRDRLQAHLRGTRPDWSKAEVDAEIARRFLRDRR